MPDITFDYAVIRVVPRVDREEFVNVGVVLSCPERQFLEARIEPDWNRLEVLAPGADRRLVEEYLGLIQRICRGGADAGPIGRLAQRERLHWLVAPRSTIIHVARPQRRLRRSARSTQPRFRPDGRDVTTCDSL